MSNDASGTMRVVAKKRETILRLLNILNYKDDEFCLYRCRNADEEVDITEKDGLFAADIFVDGAWDCSHLFWYGDHPEQHLTERKELPNGEYDPDPNAVIEKSQHFTCLGHLAQVLDFGCELFADEPNSGFCEHLAADHLGNCIDASDEFELEEDPENEDNYIPKYGMKDFGKYMDDIHIYENPPKNS